VDTSRGSQNCEASWGEGDEPLLRRWERRGGGVAGAGGGGGRGEVNWLAEETVTAVS
jgi:hypothetical protein